MNKEDIRSGIYCLENSANGKKYIGQAQNLEKRRREHGYKDRNKGCHALRNAFEKYGYDKFVYSIVEECPIESLDEREIFYIKELHSHVSEWGYNISWGGKTPQRGRKHTDEEKQKISDGQPRRYGEDNFHFGKPFTEEHKKRLSNAQRGKPGKNKGRKWTPEQKEKYMASRKYYKGEENPLYGKPKSSEAIENVRMANIANKKMKKGDDSKSRFVGVHLSEYNKWIAHIAGVYLGSFQTEIECAMAVNEYLLDEFGWRIKDRINDITIEDIDNMWNMPLEENKPRKKYLTNDQVFDIKRMIAEGKSLAEISKAFGITRNTVGKIKHNVHYCQKNQEGEDKN